MVGRLYPLKVTQLGKFEWREWQEQAVPLSIQIVPITHLKFHRPTQSPSLVPDRSVLNAVETITKIGQLSAPLLVMPADVGTGYEIVCWDGQALALFHFSALSQLPASMETVKVLVIDPTLSLGRFVKDNSVPLSPLERLEAIQLLTTFEVADDAIATLLSISRADIARYRSFSRGSLKVQAAFRAGQITVDDVLALTQTTDKRAQDELLAVGITQPQAVRRFLDDGAVLAERDPRALFVGLADYRAAGGAESVGGNGQILLHSLRLLTQLAEEKLTLHLPSVCSEGWGWVEAWPIFSFEDRAKFASASLGTSDVSVPKDHPMVTEIGRLDALHEALMREPEDNADELMRIEAIRDAIHQKIQDEVDGETDIDAGVKHFCGVVITLSMFGQVELIRGLVRPEEAAAYHEYLSEASQRLPAEADDVNADSTAARLSSGVELGLTNFRDFVSRHLIKAFEQDLLGKSVLQSMPSAGAIATWVRSAPLVEIAAAMENLLQERAIQFEPQTEMS